MARRLPGIGSHHAANPQTDEWLTPPEVVAAVGPFDLDPCAPHQHPAWTGTDYSYTATDDGLELPWFGLVWCNPPYSDAGTWMARLAEHGHGIGLVFARTETAWWHDHIWPHATSLLFLHGRLAFYRPGPPPQRATRNAGGPSVLVAYGATAHERLRTCGLPGALVAAATVTPPPPPGDTRCS